MLLGYLVTRNPFGLVMGGLGIITLTGIVVNNNIVLIDTYNVLRAGGASPLDAVLRTCVQRARRKAAIEIKLFNKIRILGVFHGTCSPERISRKRAGCAGVDRTLCRPRP